MNNIQSQIGTSNKELDFDQRQKLYVLPSTEERVNDGGCDHVICGRPLNWTRAEPMQVFYSRYLIKSDNCQILKPDP